MTPNSFLEKWQLSDHPYISYCGETYTIIQMNVLQVIKQKTRIRANIL